MYFFLATTAIALAMTAATAFADPLIKLKEIRTSGGSQPTITLVAEGPITFATHSMPTLLREIIDIPYTDPGRVEGDIPVNSGTIAKISVRKKVLGDTPHTRVIIHLQQEMAMLLSAGTEGSHSITASFRKPDPAAAPPRTTTPAHSVSPLSSGRAVDNKVTINRIEVTPTGLVIGSTAPIRTFNAFRLAAPERLVIDIPDAASSVTSGPFVANQWGIAFLRTGVFQDKLRLVFDRNSGQFPPFKAEQADRELRVTFTASATRH